MEGARLYAKFLRPRRSTVPLVLQFHGYPGASRFAEQASFAGMGMALIAMDCPGQAGYSEDAGGFWAPPCPGISLPGWTARRSGCTMSAAPEHPHPLPLVRELDSIDTSRVFVNAAVRRAAGWVWPVRR